MTQLVSYRSNQLLNCNPCSGAVVLCVEASLTASGAPYINARIASVQEKKDNLGKFYAYNFQYEEADLNNPLYRLNGCDIKGVFCRGCLTDYIDYVAGGAGAETPNSAVNTSSITFTLSGLLNRVISAVVNLSTSVGNQIQLLGDGLFVPPETPVTVSDTASVDLTASGVSGHNLSASVRVSAQAGNAVVINPDGVFVASPGAETPNSVVDTNTVNLTASGPFNRTIQADVNVSVQAGNDIQILPDGLYVAQPGVAAECPAGYFTGSPV